MLLLLVRVAPWNTIIPPSFVGFVLLEVSGYVIAEGRWRCKSFFHPLDVQWLFCCVVGWTGQFEDVWTHVYLILTRVKDSVIILLPLKTLLICCCETKSKYWRGIVNQWPMMLVIVPLFSVRYILHCFAPQLRFWRCLQVDGMLGASGRKLRWGWLLMFLQWTTFSLM